MSDEHKRTLTTIKLPAWFKDQLIEAKKATDKREARNASEIVISSVCKTEKFKKPKGFKFVKAYKKKNTEK